MAGSRFCKISAKIKTKLYKTLQEKIKQKITLALDLGSTFGWAISNLDKPITSGSVKLSQNPKTKHKRYLEFYNWLQKTINEQNGIDRIAYEKVLFHGLGSSASHLWGYWEGILLLFADKHNIELIGVSVQDIKAYAKNNTPANYQLPQEFVKKHKLDKIVKVKGKDKLVNKAKIPAITYCYSHSYNPIDSNEADARVLLDMITHLKLCVKTVRSVNC